MNIEIEFKSGTDREVVSSLRKIIGLPISHSMKVELAKRLMLDSIEVEGNPASTTPHKPVEIKDVSPDYLDRMKRRILQSAAGINKSARYRSKDDRPCTVAYLTQFTNLHPAAHVYVAECLEDPHLFAWAINKHGRSPLLMCWRSQHGTPPRLYSNLTLLTDWSLTVPPVPLI